jgi:arginase family enzyme
VSFSNLPLKSVFEILEPLFVNPEKTPSKCSFADIPQTISFLDSDVVLYGAPVDVTTSFGKGTNKGPEVIRLTSARQIETYIFEEKKDIQDCLKVFDIGDLRLPSSFFFPTVKKQKHYANKNKNKDRHLNTVFLDKVIPKITGLLYNDASKVPVMIGGEHTLSYYAIKTMAKEKPVVIHFDAHRDMKEQYEGIKMCHTTPFFHLLNEGHIRGNDLIQIGIRQGDLEENKMAENSGVATFDAWSIHDNIENVKNYLREKTQHRRIYISFDIDVYDLPYVPCTGTPEPFGLNPFQVTDIIRSMNKSAQLIGMDLVEVSLKNNDYREGALASHTLLRILSSGLIKAGSR